MINLKVNCLTGYKLIAQGEKANIYSILNNDGNDVFNVFLAELNKTCQKLIVNLINKITSRGSLVNRRSYELMKDTIDIYELKISTDGGYRMLSLRIGEKPKFNYIIIKCFKKPSIKKQRQYVRLADEIGKEIRNEGFFY